jgi:hypothetical protein
LNSKKKKSSKVFFQILYKEKVNNNQKEPEIPPLGKAFKTIACRIMPFRDIWPRNHLIGNSWKEKKNSLFTF